MLHELLPSAPRVTRAPWCRSVVLAGDGGEVAGLGEALRQVAGRVDAVPSATDGRRWLGSRAVDLLITDLHLPDGSGLDLLAWARMVSPGITCIVLTDRADMESAVAAMRLGAADYLVRPIENGAFLARVQEALDRAQAARQASIERRFLLATVESLATALEAKDRYIRGHSERVAELARRLGAALGLPESACEQLHLAGMLHDIGKIGVPETVLNKPSSLDVDELAAVRQHPSLGAWILAPIIDDTDVLSAIEYHHENFGGGGYPRSLAGDEIPLFARILSVTDAFDAMTSDRPHRRRRTTSQALALLQDDACRQWDPRIVAAFLQIAASGRDDA